MERLLPDDLQVVRAVGPNPSSGARCCDRLIFKTAGGGTRGTSAGTPQLLRNPAEAARSGAAGHAGAAEAGAGRGSGGEIGQCLALSFGFFFTFCAWHSAQNLQSSLPLHAGVKGTTALAIVYSLLGPGNFTAPAVVKRLGLKPSIVVAMGMYGR